MCEYCEGVEGKPLSSDANFKVTVEPYYSRLRIEHGCGFCDSWSFRHVDIDVCPKCGRDLRGESNDAAEASDCLQHLRGQGVLRLQRPRLRQ